MKTFLVILGLAVLGWSSFLPTKHAYNQAVVEVSIDDPVQQIRSIVKSEQSELHHLAWNRLAYIVDSYGPRLWGSESQALALEDLYQQVSKLGFDYVEKEELKPFKTWRRGSESLTLFDPRPFPQKLTVIGLGKGAPGNVTAEVLVVRTFAELDQIGQAVKGKIVLFNQAWTNYGETVSYRSRGPSAASQYGAVGVLIRSVAPVTINSPHTGATGYDSRYPQIPAAAISIEDAEMLQRIQDRGQTIRVNLYLESEWYQSTSHNLIAEIRGSEKPEEILVLGGHFDSWDTGSQTGANDDGGGVMVCLEALHTLARLGLRPKRTIRFIAWSGEEMGLPGKGADQYVERHQDELKNHVLAFESDEGTTKPYGFGFNGGKRATYNEILINYEIIVDLANTYLVPLGTQQIIPGDGQMVDTEPLEAAGIPVMRNEIADNASQDYYFTYHHSAGDTMNVLNPEDMDDNVAAIASIFFLVADLEETLPRD